MNTPVLCEFKPLEIVKEQSKRPCLIYQDIKFEKPTQIAFIIFRNYYCSHITIKYKAQNGMFVTLLSKFQLMENANYENDSQNYVRINCGKDFNSNYKKDMQFNNLRFYYYQTSPNWKTFSLTNFSFYKPILFHKSNDKNDETTTQSLNGVLEDIKQDKEIRTIVSLKVQ
ncbi:hypothetical protein C9374_005112 [Naegleria lovaniensis]|uniref:Uncharacterized protein n=1 Tax=Naegleria lovaniensis TaxID=51637 RepID=A0AA88KIS4_NAELO|nr:uncharacterized protein C9374_005112 [Naegleria lovaniensis]KAG2382532.1 hypothetical protein C9374_005112 [Naegleria lovaniensis]